MADLYVFFVEIYEINTNDKELQECVTKMVCKSKFLNEIEESASME